MAKKQTKAGNSTRKVVTANSYLSEKALIEGFNDVINEMGWTPHYETYRSMQQNYYEAGRLIAVWFKTNNIDVRPGTGRWPTKDFLYWGLRAYKEAVPEPTQRV